MISTDERVEGRDYPSSAAVDLAAIRHNLGVLRAAAPGALQLATVKANAYGHGLLPVARAALDGGADWLGVAQLAEAFTLRRGLDEAGVARADAPILAWISTSSSDFAAAIEADIDLSVSWTWVLADICAAAREAGRPARVHVKIDTGMSRAGSTLADLPALASALRMAADDGLVDVVGAWSHMSRADDLSEAGNASTASHVRIFEEGLAILADAGVTPRIRHLSATSGILWHPEAHYDMVRAGIGLYGLSPDPAVAASEELGLIPALELRAPLTSVKVIEEGTPASYGGTWVAPTRRWIGLVPLGYGDGILRAVSNKARVVVHTASGPFNAPIVGRVCMDQFMVDLGPAEGSPGTPTARSGQAPAAPGDIATLFGSGAGGEALADDWAQAAGTINYEIVTHLGAHIPRIYRDGVAATFGSNS
ncbi:alanine racemase [Schaalia sp. ORNL0103]|uniref:alanine racemase n=1 Tax=Schaalia sp. ORNL0103 TaxID=2789426 RepID=UPI001CA52AE4|nr:alanine racemase [Schaalia sp. ORNL0103]MBW6413217.1 alanine racemase [Schaalia sp. ORNL0103]